MFGRLGTYYPVYRVHLDQHRQLEGREGRKPSSLVAARPAELGMLVRMISVVAVVAVGATLLAAVIG